MATEEQRIAVERLMPFTIHISDSELDNSTLEEDAQLAKQLDGKVFCLYGPPGAGKGTHCQAIVRRLGVLAISSGDLFRDEVRRGTALGQVLGPIMAAGEFVPREICRQVLTARLSQPDARTCGILLDGQIRHTDHLDDVDAALSAVGKQLAGVVHIQISEAEAVARIATRAHASADSHAARADDHEATVRKRYAKYLESTPSLLDVLMKRDILYHMSGQSTTVERTTNKLLEVMCYPRRFQQPPSAFVKLERLLPVANHPSAAAFRPLALAFRDAALLENAAKRTGAMRRFVYLATTSAPKLAEFERVFDRYGVEVIQLPPVANTMRFFLEALLSDKSADLIPVAVLREESGLFKPGTMTLSSLRTRVQCDHVSTMHAWMFEGAPPTLTERSYSHSTKCRLIDATGDVWNIPVFGWDDRCVVEATGRTYQAHKAAGLKISSRDQVISLFLKDRIYYKELKNLKHTPVEMMRPLDFDVDVAAFLQSKPHYNTPLAADIGLVRMQHHVLNEGIFFKAADTRLEANYWQPGLNAGLPLISKKDPIHEETFMFHDIGHFMMKDLIFTGHDSPLHRQVYIISRMISEAVTIMMADGVFVNTLDRSGIAYDFKTRCIYPLFQGTGLDFSDKATIVANLRTIMQASVDYTVKGDESTFRNLLTRNGVDLVALEMYKDKFKPFFVSDYQWTAHNYEYMASHSDEMRVWWHLSAPVRAKLDLTLETIDEFMTHMRPAANADAADVVAQVSDLVDRVFDVIFDRRVAPVFAASADSEIALLPTEVRVRRGFLRWCIGQMGVYARFRSVPDCEAHMQRFIAAVVADEPIGTVRRVYEEFLAVLERKNLISTDDMHNFTEIYPLFEPFYVSYDKNEEYVDIAPLAARLLHVKKRERRGAQLQMVNQFMGRSLTPAEVNYIGHMTTMVEAGDGRIEDGMFVSVPSVCLLAVSGLVDNAFGLGAKLEADANVMHASFLLAGLSVESSLELIAHGEAAVARLTTSKTNAMNVPMFRVQGAGSGDAKQYLRRVQMLRRGLESEADPKQAWGAAGVELWNATNSGAKATALVYTMTLADFGKVFIGRMGESGNELEVRELVRRMATILHGVFPDVILSADAYLALTNGEKYKASAAVKLEKSAEAVVSASGPTVALVMDTVLTSAARALFTKMNIDTAQSDAHQLSEFRSRITYLAFASERKSATAYINKMIVQFQHLSITSAVRVGVALGPFDAAAGREFCTVACNSSGALCQLVNSTVIVSTNLKTFHKLLNVLATPSHSSWHDIARQMAELLHRQFGFVIGTKEAYGLRYYCEPVSSLGGLEGVNIHFKVVADLVFV